MTNDGTSRPGADADAPTTERSLALAVVGLRSLLGLLLEQLQAVELLLPGRGVITADALRAERDTIPVAEGPAILAHIDRQPGPLFADGDAASQRIELSLPDPASGRILSHTSNASGRP